MKKSILAVMMLFSVAVFFVSCKEKPKEEVATEEAIVNPETAMNDAFACPMKCEGDKTYSEEGSCPTCGMELVLVESIAVDSLTTDESHEGHDH